MKTTDLPRKLKKLFRLAFKNKPIYLTDIDTDFRDDLLNFIVGETLSSFEGKPIIGKNLYKRWLGKLINSGFNYDLK